MIKNEFFDNGFYERTGAELTDEIVNLGITEFSDAYWLGWINYNNLPTSYHISKLEVGGNTIAFSDILERKNYDIGYISLFTRNTTATGIKPVILYGGDPITANIEESNIQSLCYINKLDAMSTGVDFFTRGASDYWQLLFTCCITTTSQQTQEQKTTYRQKGYKFETLKDFIDFLNGDKEIELDFQMAQYDHGTPPRMKTPLISGFDFQSGCYQDTIVYEDENPEYSDEKYTNEILCIISEYRLSSHISMKVEGETIVNGAYIMPTPVIKVECDEKEFLIGCEQVFVYSNGFKRMGIIDRRHGEYTFNRNPWGGNNFLGDDLLLGKLEGTYSIIEDGKSHITFDGNLLFYQSGTASTSGNCTISIFCSYSPEDILHHLGINMRLIENDGVGGPLKYSYHKDLIYAPYITSNEEFTGQLITGDLEDEEFRSLLRPWQYDINEWENNTYRPFTYEDKYYNFELKPSYQSFIRRLITGSNSIDDNLSEKNFDSTQMKYNDEIYTNRANELWIQLLHHLSNKANYTNPHYGVRKNDFPEDYDSVVEAIGKNIDFDFKENQLFLKTYLNTKENQSYWNLSVSKIIDLYYNFFKAGEEVNWQISNSNLIYDDIKNANAGNSFSKDNNKWVMPNNNIDGQTYSEVRGNDTILEILTNKNNLQFTNEIQKYLNLIMPSYKRNIEIEDLNRNFWVIGQNLTALYAFLFDENSPLPTLLSAILDEIVQLWENIFYLWLENALLTQKKKNENIKTIIIESAISINETDNPREFLENFWDYHGNDIINKFNGDAIVVIPEVKENNYMKNYYSKAIYPGIIIYDNSLSLYDNLITYIPFSQALVIDLKEKEIELKTFGQEVIENE